MEREERKDKIVQCNFCGSCYHSKGRVNILCKWCGHHIIVKYPKVKENKDGTRKSDNDS